MPENEFFVRKRAHSYMQRQFLKMVSKSPELWSKTEMSSNPCISVKLIKSYKSHRQFSDWDWKLISSNPGIYEDDILEHQDLPWNWNFVLTNPNVSLGFILEEIDDEVTKSDMGNALSSSKSITVKDIKEHWYIQWNWCLLTSNPSITLDDIEKFPDLPWDPDALSMRRAKLANPVIDSNVGCTSIVDRFDFANVKKEHHELFDWNAVSSNINLTIDFVIENPSLPWNYKELSANHFPRQFENVKEMIRNGVSMCDRHCRETLEQKFQRIILEKVHQTTICRSCSSKLITMDFVRKHSEKPWNSIHLSANPNVTMDIVREFDFIEWNYGILTSNPGITIDDIDQNPDLSWNWGTMNTRNDLTMKFIRKYIDKSWDWFALYSYNNIVVEHFDELFAIHPEHHENVIYNSNVTLEFVKNNPYLPWKFSDAKIKDITAEFINSHKCVNWNWKHIFMHSSINPCDITKTNNDFWKYVPYSSNFTINYFEQNMENLTSWSILSQHAKCITPEYVRANPYLPWDWTYIAVNPNFTPRTVDRTKEGKSIFNRIVYNGSIDELCEYVAVNDEVRDKLSWTTLTTLFKTRSIEDIVNNPTLPWVWSLLL